MKIGKEFIEHVWIDRYADDNNNPNRDGESHHQPAAAHQAETISIPPFCVPCPNTEHNEQSQRYIPNPQRLLREAFDILHMAELSFVVKRLAILKFQIP